MKITKYLAAIIFFTVVFSSVASAQFVDPTTGDVTFPILGCDGITHTFSIVGIDFNEFTNIFTFSVTIDGRSKTFSVDITKVDDFDATTGRFADPNWQAYLDFILQGLGCAVAGGFGESVAPSDPVVSQNLQAFKRAAFSERAKPRAAGKRVKKTKEAREKEAEEEDREAAPLMPNEMSSDIEYEFFDINGNGGSNFAIRAGYTRVSDDGEWSYGSNLILNNLSFDNVDEGFTNNFINSFATKILTETDTKETSVGGSFNLLLIDEDFSPDNGFALGVFYVERLYIEERIITYGAMFLQSKVGDLSTTYLNAAGMYGFPIGERYAMNIDALYMRNLRTAFAGESVDLESNNILSLGANGSIFMSETFGLNAGFKTTLLVKDYSSFEITIGGGVRF